MIGLIAFSYCKETFFRTICNCTLENILEEITSFISLYTLRISLQNKECHRTVRNRAYLNSFINLRLRFWSL